MTTSGDEATRVRAVYGAYAERGDTARWDHTQPGNRAIEDERDRRIRRFLPEPALLGRLEVLDIGCGNGHVLERLVGWGASPARVHGVDLLPDRVEIAAARDPRFDVRVADAAALPDASSSYDMVLAYTVFSSILDTAVTTAVAREIDRVLRPGGSVVWYDLRVPNPNNREVRAVPRREVHRLFPGYRALLTSITVLPPLARRLGGRTDALYPLLARVPPLRTHLVGRLIAPAGAGA